MEMLENILGLKAQKVLGYHMVARAFIIFFTALIFIRLAGLRTLGKQSSFDILTILMLGAIMGHAIYDNQSFVGHILAALLIMMLHRLIAWITFKSKKAGAILKGRSLLLMKDGEKQLKNLRKEQITDEDIMEALRHDVNFSSMDKIKEVYLERSGEISIVKE